MDLHEGTRYRSRVVHCKCLHGAYTGIFLVQGFITGEVFEKSRKSLFILQGFPVIFCFPVYLTGFMDSLYILQENPYSFTVNVTGIPC